MTLFLWIPFVICLCGLVIYGISNNPKGQAIALHAYWVGLFVTLMELSGRLVLK